MTKSSSPPPLSCIRAEFLDLIKQSCYRPSFTTGQNGYLIRSTGHQAIDTVGVTWRVEGILTSAGNELYEHYLVLMETSRIVKGLVRSSASELCV